MKGKRVIAGILLAGILAVTLAGCKNTDNTKEESEKPVITLGSDSYPPYNYLNEDGVPTGIDVELATEAFKRMGYQVNVVQINWEEKKELVESGKIDCIMGSFSMEGRHPLSAGAGADAYRSTACGYSAGGDYPFRRSGGVLPPSARRSFLFFRYRAAAGHGPA